MARRTGYFPRLEKLMSDNEVALSELIEGSGLVEKSVRRMVNKSAPSLYTSVEKVVEFLNKKGLGLQLEQEFTEAG